MILAIDIQYNDPAAAKAVGALFHWNDEQPLDIVIKFIEDVAPYVPGEFYKRELPGILKIIERIDLKELEAIIVDGHVYVDNNKSFGLGAYVWKAIEGKVPVIGVAKRGFYNNKETVVEVVRGTSENPLHVSAIGINKDVAAKKIQQMHGAYRIPTLLKIVDTLTKNDNY